jgi:hypothetical protein
MVGKTTDKVGETKIDPRNPRRINSISGIRSFPLEDKEASFNTTGEGETALRPKNPRQIKPFAREEG